MAAVFKDLKKLLNLSYNRFIRTTDKEHIEAVWEFWRRCKAAGDIYKKKYRIKYCVGCELEKTDSELINGRCPLHPDMEIELIEEENYFFRFSKYQNKLLKLYQERPSFILPNERFNEIKKFVESGINDFSISRLREKMSWGIPVPDDDFQVIYVWFDALVNYISTLGWPKNKNFDLFWPAVQLAGKDNLRQQSAMWQAMLFSAGITPSRKIIISGFISVNGKKMSKSIGNVITPTQMVNRYGTDATRYLLSSLNFAKDTDVSWEKFDEKYNADLAHGIGNLVSRIVKLTQKLPKENLLENKKSLITIGQFSDLFDNGRIDTYLEKIWEMIRKMDRDIEQKKPWELAKNNFVGFKKIMNSLIENLVSITILLKPVMPETTQDILEILKNRESRILFSQINNRK